MPTLRCLSSLRGRVFHHMQTPTIQCQIGNVIVSQECIGTECLSSCRGLDTWRVTERLVEGDLRAWEGTHGFSTWLENALCDGSLGGLSVTSRRAQAPFSTVPVAYARAFSPALLAASPWPSFLINWKRMALHKPNKQVASLAGSSSSRGETEWDKLRAEHS